MTECQKYFFIFNRKKNEFFSEGKSIFLETHNWSPFTLINCMPINQIQCSRHASILAFNTIKLIKTHYNESESNSSIRYVVCPYLVFLQNGLSDKWRCSQCPHVIMCFWSIGMYTFTCPLINNCPLITVCNFQLIVAQTTFFLCKSTVLDTRKTKCNKKKKRINISSDCRDLLHFASFVLCVCVCDLHPACCLLS